MYCVFVLLESKQLLINDEFTRIFEKSSSLTMVIIPTQTYLFLSFGTSKDGKVKVCAENDVPQLLLQSLMWQTTKFSVGTIFIIP